MGWSECVGVVLSSYSVLIVWLPLCITFLFIKRNITIGICGVADKPILTCINQSTYEYWKMDSHIKKRRLKKSKMLKVQRNKGSGVWRVAQNDKDRNSAILFRLHTNCIQNNLKNCLIDRNVYWICLGVLA